MAAIEDFPAWVAARVPWQAAIEAIGNKIKHADNRDMGWENGTVMVARFVPDLLQAHKDACKDGLELFGFMHQHREVVWWDVALRRVPNTEAELGYVALGDASSTRTSMSRMSPALTAIRIAPFSWRGRCSMDRSRTGRFSGVSPRVRSEGMDCC